MCTQLSNNAVLLQLCEPSSPSSWVSSETYYNPLRLETVYKTHSLLFGASLFSLPTSQVPQTDADQGTVMLAIVNVVWLQTTLRKHIKPTFLVNCFDASLLKIIFLSPDVSQIKVAGLKQKQTFLPVAYEANAA